MSNGTRAPLASTIKNGFEEDVKKLLSRAAWARAGRDRVRKVLAAIDKLPSADDIDYASQDVPWYRSASDPIAFVFFTLRDGRQDSAILREIVSALHVKITKTPHYSGTGLIASFTVGQVRYEISGYRPPTCRIEETKVETEMTDVIIRDGKAYRTTIKHKVVCLDTQTPEGADEDAVI